MSEKRHKFDSPEYRAWVEMKRRCYNQNFIGYKNYGGRGIVVCKRWNKSFESFFADMGVKPTPKHQLDRIDNNGNYTPANCRWATAKANSNNKRSCVTVTIDGRTMTLAQWADAQGIGRAMLYKRISEYGWSPEDAILTPKGATQHRVTATINGRTQTIFVWARELGVSAITLYSRIRDGWSPEEAILTPIGVKR